MSKRSLEDYVSLNYSYELVKDEAQGGFFISHPDLPGCMAEGETADEALANLDDARELWIESRLEGGYPVPEPLNEEFSGRLSLRMSSVLHRDLAKEAIRTGASLNMTINTILAGHIGGVRQIDEMKKLFRATEDQIKELKTIIRNTVPQVAPFFVPRIPEMTMTGLLDDPSSFIFDKTAAHDR